PPETKRRSVSSSRTSRTSRTSRKYTEAEEPISPTLVRWVRQQYKTKNFSVADPDRSNRMTAFALYVMSSMPELRYMDVVGAHWRSLPDVIKDIWKGHADR